MSYEEEAIYIAKVKLQWAEEGFRKSVKHLKESIENYNNDEIIAMVNALKLDKFILEEAEQYYNFIMNKYGKEIAE